MNKITFSFMTQLIAIGLILSACGLPGNPDILKGTTWKLVSYGSLGKQTPAEAGIQTSLDFGTDGTVNGNMGCNAFGGNYEVKNGRILFTQILSTMMACQGPQMDQEQKVLKVMNGSVQFQLQENTLVIYSADGVEAITLSR